MTNPIIAKEFRNGYLENTHHGIICVIDENKDVIYSKGSMDQSVFYRSALKPIQAIPIFSTDIVKKYQLTEEESALFAASQRGEVYHEKALISLVEKLGIQEDSLICNQSYPLNEQPKEQYIADHKCKRKLLHNCAGKHLGFLAYARESGYSMEDYYDPSHPLQQEILNHVAMLAEIPVEQVVTGIDGCGVPVHAVPIREMAKSYLKFAVPDLIEDVSLKDAVEKVAHVMNQQPNIIASHHFICSALLKDNNIIAKGGAQGVYCLALKKEKISIALKVLSGTENLWPLLVAELLVMLNYSNQNTIERLLEIKSLNITNDNGKVIGNTKIYL
ncbi:asparaginase [Aquibacillus saliphilus]|uniref:asparaginase n=1 Tax=Aquibacillus saliphilus TaxID=1909422 RepID=UPI001CF03D36|nr:asparaginase [Aquibacillus saliphilus]